MEQRPSLEANWFSAKQEICWNPKVHLGGGGEGERGNKN